MPNRFEALDALRGIAALGVLTFHLKLLGSISELAFFKNSFFFVDFFFVLSGFVLAHGYAYKENVSFKKFALSRFLRLYPIHLFLFLVIFCLEFGKMIVADFFNIQLGVPAFSGRTAVSEIIPNLLLIQAWFPQFNPDSFNGFAWSISIEFYMYFIFIASVLFFGKRKEAVWILLSLGSFIFIATGLDILTPHVERGLSAFFLGSLTYALRRRYIDLQLKTFQWSILEAIFLCIMCFAIAADFEHKRIVMPFVFLTTVFVFSYDSGMISKLFQISQFQYLGLLSYSIYMTQFAIALILTYFATILGKITGQVYSMQIDGELVLTFGGAVVNNIMLLLLVITTITISHFTYKYIEMRFNYKRLFAKN